MAFTLKREMKNNTGSNIPTAFFPPFLLLLSYLCKDVKEAGCAVDWVYWSLGSNEILQ